jgi:hypothetical protein
MMLSDKYTIYGDFDIKDNLCEYFNCKNIIFDFITNEDNDVPLIDKILYKSDKNKKILLIIDYPTIKKLYQQVSEYNNFLKLVDDGRIDLIFYWDSITELEDGEILKKLKFTWLYDCFVSEGIKRQFKNIEFYQLPYGAMDHHQISHLLNLKNNGIEKKNTFFSLLKKGRPILYLMPFWQASGKHKNLLLQQMQGKEYLKDAIMKVDDKILDKIKDPLFFKDLEFEYGKIFLDGAKTKDGLPVISYYENTCFELVNEALGEVDCDDSFYLTKKTIKPIVMGHPFMVLSTKHFLKNLKELGFKTFGDFIDESYDECDNAGDRVDIISKNLERLDMTESKKFYNDTRPICDHNQNHLMYLQGRYKFDLWKNLDKLFKKY